MLTKKTLVVAAMVAALGAGAVGVGVTHAAANPDGSRPRFATEIASAIATKFGLSQSDVQAVIDAQASTHRDEIRAARDAKFDDALSQAVADGSLTQSQADAITAKRDEMKTFMESLKDETPEQRRADMKAKVEELKALAKENGIPEQYVRFVLPPPPGMMGHMGARMHGGMMGSIDESAR
ncbi:MAG: hypothetical protein WCO25_02595 [Candidatus Uhrbacteria bacterium]